MVAAKIAQPLAPQRGVRIESIDYNCNQLSRDGIGNNAKYLTARIARDRPDILGRMKAGVGFASGL